MLTYFTPGPAQLYPTFEKHLKAFANQQLGSISHRSQAYRDIHKFTVEQLRELLGLPETHRVFFLGSASEAWERILLNSVEHESFHLVNGAFSNKFFQYALAVGKHAHLLEKPLGQGFDASEITVPEYAELIALTHNETSAGVQMKVSEIHKLKRAHPGKLLAVDMVSSAPYPKFDYKLVDSAFFSVQKAFGMPAGLGVWIANERFLAKAESLKGAGLSLGAHHDLPTLWKFAEKNETQATPNVMAIYLLGKISEDMNRLGIEKIRKNTEHNARLLYRYLRQTDSFSPFVEEERHQSQTVIVANVAKPAKEIIETLLKKHDWVIGSGYGPQAANQVRIANFPATTTRQIEELLKVLA